MKKIPKELNSAALQVLRRLGRGERVESTHWGRHSIGRTMEDARKALLDGYVVERTTLKGRKRWFEITSAGTALLPAIAEQDKKRSCEIEAENERIHREEMVRGASQDLLGVVLAVIVWYENAGTSDPDQKSAGSVELYGMAKAAREKAGVQ